MSARVSLTLVVLVLTAACGGGTPAGASAAASPTAPPVHVVVTYGSVAADVLPTWVALEAGIFQRNGLDVDLQLISSSTAAVAALVSRNADFSQAGGSEAISANVGGADLVVVSITGATYSYLLEAAPEIKSPNDLKGKKVGISTAGSSSDVAVRVALKKVGLEPDKDVAIVPVGDVPTRVAAMKGGAIQATVVNPPETTSLEQAGFHSILDLAGLKLAASLQTTIVRRDTINTQAGVVQKYVDSQVQSIAYMKKNKPFVIGVLKKYFKSTDDAAMSAAFDFYISEVYPAQPFPKPELFADAITTLATRNDKVKGFDASKIIDPSFVQKAVDRGLDKG